jgi:hypothetical protein
VLFAAKLKLNEFGLADRGLLAPDEFMLSVTGIVRNVGPGPAMLIKPTSLPVVGAPVPIDTVSESGVVPLVGVTTSQFVSEKVESEMFAGPLAEETRTV